MIDRPTTMERAFELARSGDCAGIGDIKTRLHTEGFSDVTAQISGPTLLASLRRICIEARALADPTPNSPADQSIAL